LNHTQRHLPTPMSKPPAHIIIPPHPHLLQPIQLYNPTPIFYSFPNFIFHQRWSRTPHSPILQYHLNEQPKPT
ncbi:CapA family protein, partial [Bacillus altitudinis]|uniref:CapA family protein n=1 Tax=Bacillus altitudinis TaxID=293387 RepID=UPI001642E073